MILIVFILCLVGTLYCYDTMTAKPPATTSNASCQPDPHDQEKWQAG